MSISSSIARPSTRPPAADNRSATSGSRLETATRTARRALGLIALLVALGLAAGCTSSQSETCNSISGQICERLADCDSLYNVFATQDMCVDSFNGLFEVDGSDDAACRDTWSATRDLECTEFLDYFSI